VANLLTCDFEHERTVPAVVRLEIKSTRASKPGHPMVRVTGSARPTPANSAGWVCTSSRRNPVVPALTFPQRSGGARRLLNRAGFIGGSNL